MPVFCEACRLYRAESYGDTELGPCPKCGADITVWYPAGQEFRLLVGGIELRSVRRGRTRRHWEAKSQSKHEVYTLDGKTYWIERTIDRIAHEYHERIVDPETGQVVREVHEPLTEHHDRGSARKRASKPPSSDGAA
jgi:hypothetical protein